MNDTIKLPIWESKSGPSIWKWLTPSIKWVSTLPAADLSLFCNCLTLVNPSLVPITKSLGFGDCNMALWCLPKRIEAVRPNGYPKLTYPTTSSTLSTAEPAIGAPAKLEREMYRCVREIHPFLATWYVAKPVCVLECMWTCVHACAHESERQSTEIHPFFSTGYFIKLGVCVPVLERRYPSTQQMC